MNNNKFYSTINNNMKYYNKNITKYEATLGN